MSSLRMYTRARLMSDGHARRFVCSRNFVLLIPRYVYEIILQGSQIYTVPRRDIPVWYRGSPRYIALKRYFAARPRFASQPARPVRARRTRAVCVTPSKWILSSLVCSIIN